MPLDWTIIPHLHLGLWPEHDGGKTAGNGPQASSGEDDRLYPSTLSPKDYSDPARLAEDLGCSTDYLLGVTDQLTPAALSTATDLETDGPWHWWPEQPQESDLYWCITGPMSHGGSLYWWNAEEEQWEHPAMAFQVVPSVRLWMRCPQLPESMSWEAGGKKNEKKTSLKELRSFSKAELIRYVQYVEGEPLRAHHTAARTYIYELRLERVNKRYDAAVEKLSSLTQGDKTLQGLVEWTKAHETVSRCIAELERLEKLLYG